MELLQGSPLVEKTKGTINVNFSAVRMTGISCFLTDLPLFYPVPRLAARPKIFTLIRPIKPCWRIQGRVQVKRGGYVGAETPASHVYLAIPDKLPGK